jgi:hypothetical protein
LNSPFGRYGFWTDSPVTNREKGCTALRLHHETVKGLDLKPASDREAAIVAEVVCWDDPGHYHLKTFNGDVPFEIIEALIEEAKETIKYKYRDQAYARAWMFRKLGCG